MTLTLITTCTSQGEENAVISTTPVYKVFDSNLSVVVESTISWIMW